MEVKKTAFDYLDEGDRLLKSGNLEEAIAAYRRAIELNPDLSWSHHNLGEALAKLGQFEDAIAAFRRAIELKPDFSWSYHHLGDALAQQEQWEESATAFRKAIELNPQHFGTYVGLGNCLAKMGQLNEASAAYRCASELEPEADWIHYRLGEVLQQRTQVDLEGAIVSYRQVIELNPDDVEAYYKLVELQPDNWEILLCLGKALFKQHNIEGAINCYRRVVELKPDLEEGYQQLGELLLQQGDIEGAIYQGRISLDICSELSMQGYFSTLKTLKLKLFVMYYQLGKTLNDFTHQQIQNLLSNRQSGSVLLNEIKKEKFSSEISQLNDIAFIKATESLSEEEFVQEVFQAYLRREIETGAKQGFAQGIRSGSLTRLTTLSGIRQSPEFNLLLSTKQNKLEEEIAIHWRILEIKHEYLSEQINCYQQALQLSPDFYEPYYDLGEALTTKGNLLEANIAYKRALSIGIRLAKSRCLEAALSCYKKALYVIPEKLEIYSALGILLVKMGQIKELVNCYKMVSIFNPETVNFYHELTFLLLQQGLEKEARYCLVNTSSILPRLSERDVYQKIWQRLNHINPVNLDIKKMGATEVEINQEAAQEYFTATSQYRVITLNTISTYDIKYLEKIGISMTILELLAQNKWELQQIYLHSYNNFDKNQVTHNINLIYAYQQILIETGYIYAVCPLSGMVLKSNQSFVFNHYDQKKHDLQAFIYKFIGKEIFYLMTGCVAGDPVLVYFPSRELIINFHQSLLGFAKPADSINKLKSYLISHWQEVNLYMTSMEKKVVNLVALGYNIGHYLWQDLGGLEILARNNLLSKVDKILIGPGEYFRVADIFPEIPKEKFIYIQDEVDAFNKVIENNSVAVRANAHSYIDERFAGKICKASLKNCSSDFLAKVKKAQERFPLLAIQIRVSSRIWIGQVEGIANIIKSLFSEFPGLGVLFDGWSLTGQENIDSSSLPVIEKEKNTVEQIMSLIPPDVSIYSAIGCTVYETVAWNLAIDLHISPMGAGLTFPSWIANKPGVIHGSPDVLDNNGWEVTTARTRENMTPHILLPKEHIFYFDPVTYNYDCDWQVIKQQARKIIKELKKIKLIGN